MTRDFDKDTPNGPSPETDQGSVHPTNPSASPEQAAPYSADLGLEAELMKEFESVLGQPAGEPVASLPQETGPLSSQQSNQSVQPIQHQQQLGNNPLDDDDVFAEMSKYDVQTQSPKGVEAVTEAGVGTGIGAGVEPPSQPSPSESWAPSNDVSDHGSANTELTGLATDLERELAQLQDGLSQSIESGHLASVQEEADGRAQADPADESQGLDGAIQPFNEQTPQHNNMPQEEMPQPRYAQPKIAEEQDQVEQLKFDPFVAAPHSSHSSEPAPLKLPTAPQLPPVARPQVARPQVDSPQVDSPAVNRSLVMPDLAGDESQLDRSIHAQLADEDGVDMSKILSPDDDVEAVTEFDIPEVADIAPSQRITGQMDMGLDLELEEEFSQLLTDKSSSQPDIATPDQPAQDNQETIGEFFGLEPEALLEQQTSADKPDASLLPGLAAATLAQSRPQPPARPDKIEVMEEPLGDTLDDQTKEKEVADNNHVKYPVIAGLAAIVLLGGGALIWQYMSSQVDDLQDPIIISADSDAIKQVPSNPGGALVPNQDQAVYDLVEGNDVSVTSQSELLETREEPIDIVQQTLDPNILPRNISTQIADDRLLPTNEGEDALVASQEAQPLVVPRKVRTVIVQSDGTIITRNLPESPSSSQSAGETEIAATAQQPDAASINADNDSGRATSAALNIEPVGQASAPTSDQVNNQAPTNIVPIPSNTQQVAAAIDQAVQQVIQASPTDLTGVTEPAVSANAVQTDPVNPTASTPVVSSNFSGFYMQIASQPSLQAAQTSYNNLNRQFSSILGGLPVEYQEAVIEGRGTFHRVRLQIGSRTDAVSLCERYKSAGGSCFVTR